jgi:hypothetical protein
MPNPGLMFLQEGGELPSEGKVLEDEVTPRAEPREKCDHEGREEPEHGGQAGCLPRAKSSNNSGATGSGEAQARFG